MSPRMAWRAIQAALPRDAIISSDIGNNCAIGNAYPTFEEGRKYLAPGLFGPCGYGLPAIVGAKIGCPDMPVVGFAGDGAFGIAMTEMTAIGRKEWPAITMVVFRNYQWGAEKRNSTLWYDDNFVGTELDPNVSYARSRGPAASRASRSRTMDELTAALQGSLRGQMQEADHAHRGDPQPGAGRAVPPRRDEEAGGRRGHPARGHAASSEALNATVRGAGRQQCDRYNRHVRASAPRSHHCRCSRARAGQRCGYLSVQRGLDRGRAYGQTPRLDRSDPGRPFRQDRRHCPGKGPRSF